LKFFSCTQRKIFLCYNVLRFIAGAIMDGTKIDLSQETQALAQRIAEAKHTTVDEAVKEALEAAANAAGIPAAPAHDVSPHEIAKRREATKEFVDAIAAMPILDKRPLQEIVDDINTI
jgi:antitoxin VapB